MSDDRPTPRESTAAAKPRVGVIMGSRSDWGTMQHAADVLAQLHIPFEVEVVSAHRTPDKLFDYAEAAEPRGLEVIIAGAGGAAHLPGMCAAKTILPVLGVPIESAILRGVDSLLSIVQMPAGVPVGTLAIGKAGAINAALLAATIVPKSDFRAAALYAKGALWLPGRCANMAWHGARCANHDRPHWPRCQPAEQHHHKQPSHVNVCTRCACGNVKRACPTVHNNVPKSASLEGSVWPHGFDLCYCVMRFFFWPWTSTRQWWA